MDDSDDMLNPQATYVYYDGWCRACIKSADLFVKLDKSRGILECVDIRNENDPRIKLLDIDHSALTTSLHTRTPDGNVFSAPEAIRRAFSAVGKQRSASWTGLPIIRPIVDYCYGIFARNRLRWFATHECKDGACMTKH